MLMRRARPALGTLVSIQVETQALGEAGTLAAVETAFTAIATVHRLMSAHLPDSDLARLASARPGEAMDVHTHTLAVLRAARHWQAASNGAFDALAAGLALARRGLRPALDATDHPASLARLDLDSTPLRLPGPLPLDLGGIAKGYAVDLAVQALRQAGVGSGLVNAGGDLRAFGPRAWPVELQHRAVPTRSCRLLRLRDAALASSVRSVGGEFVATARRPGPWRQATVLARDCMSADALTKWALQARAPSLQLRAALRAHAGRLWRA